MQRLLLFHDFTSPFCRLAVPIAFDVADRAGLRLRPVPFELHPAPEPLPPADPRAGDDLEAAQAAAREWGIELGRLTRVPRTRKAHEAIAFARDHDAVSPMVRGLYDALWQRHLDISRLDVLADIGEAAGLDREALHVALGTDVYENEVAREQEAAAAAGLTGVPTFQVRDVVAVGLLGRDELLEWVEANR